MSWMVKRIQEDDFGCEERPDDAKAQVLVTLADISDEELAEMASEKTERRFDREPDTLFRKWMRPSEDWPEETDLKLKICAIFDAYIMWEYSKVKQIPYN